MEIQAKSISFSAGEKRIIDSISLDLKNNEFVGIIGPNGSGKSTFLKCLYRVLKPQSGTVLIDNKPLAKMSYKESARKTAVVAQQNNSAFDFRVLDMVLMGRAPFKGLMESYTDTDIALATHNLEIVGMQEFVHENFSVLSGGEQQRVILARALTQTPRCLLLDEPTNHLDIKYQLQLLDIVKGQACTVCAVLHDLNLACKYCDKIAVIKDGKLFTYGTPKEVITEKFIKEVYEVDSNIVDFNGRLVVIYN